MSSARWIVLIRPMSISIAMFSVSFKVLKSLPLFYGVVYFNKGSPSDLNFSNEFIPAKAFSTFD
jgi:hypothetical protein